MALSGKLVGLWKQGLNEIPELIFSGITAAIFVTAAAFKVHYNDRHENHNKVYKFLPVLMRPDDPRAAKVHKP